MFFFHAFFYFFLSNSVSFFYKDLSNADKERILINENCIALKMADAISATVKWFE